MLCCIVIYHADIVWRCAHRARNASKRVRCGVEQVNRVPGSWIFPDGHAFVGVGRGPPQFSVATVPGLRFPNAIGFLNGSVPLRFDSTWGCSTTILRYASTSRSAGQTLCWNDQTPQPRSLEFCKLSVRSKNGLCFKS